MDARYLFDLREAYGILQTLVLKTPTGHARETLTEACALLMLVETDAQQPGTIAAFRDAQRAAEG